MKKVIVHFGAGEYLPGEHGPPVRPNESHIIFDIKKPPQLHPVSQSLVQRGLRSPIFKLQDASRTGLRVESADVIHIHNVFSDPKTANRVDLLKEAARILKPNGEIFVGETLTPYVFTKEELEKLAGQCGLKVETLVENSKRTARMAYTDSERKITEGIMGPGGTSLKIISGKMYLVKLTKS
ncbi:MAG: class I SAM-dependent methyltransferase [Candidatus Micrarchaeota archaeon]|nr:class I SAM-dependent methyltransferase [Candidatus Micrarchaeota archaeon]